MLFVSVGSKIILLRSYYNAIMPTVALIEETKHNGLRFKLSPMGIYDFEQVNN